jgi:hypothetical protein
MPFDSLLNLGISNKEGNRCVAIPYGASSIRVASANIDLQLQAGNI